MKFISIMSTIFCSLLLILIIFYTGLTANGFDGNIVISTLYFSLLYPISNIFKMKKKVITNIIYHLLVWFFCFFNFYIYVKSLILLLTVNYNESVLYCSDFFIFNVIGCIFIYLFSLMLKKDLKIGKGISHRLSYILIMILSIIPILNNSKFIGTQIGYINFFFAFYLLIKFNDIIEKEKMQTFYIFMIILSLISLNFISMIILIRLYIDLDKILQNF